MDVFISARYLGLSFLAGLGRLQNTMMLVALFAASRESGFSLVESSTIGSAFFLSAAASAIWKGRLVDRLGRGVVQKQALLLLLAFLLLLLALLFFPWWVAALATLLLGTIRLNPGILQQALWTELHERKDLLARALAWENLVSFLAQTGGPLLAALLIFLGGGVLSLAATGALTVAAMSLWGILSPKKPLVSERTSGHLRGILPLAMILFFVVLSAGLLQGILLGALPSDRAALMIAAYTLGAGLASLFYFRRSLPERFWRLGISLAPLLLLAPILFLSSDLLPAALLLSGALFATGSLSCNLFVKHLVPEDRVNEAFSYLLTGLALGASAGIFLSGPILQLAPSPSPPLLLVGASVIIVNQLLLRRVR